MQNCYCDSEVPHINLNVGSFDKFAKDCCIEFCKSFIWVGVEEFLFKWITSFAQENFEKKWKKKIIVAMCFTTNRRSY